MKEERRLELAKRLKKRAEDLNLKAVTIANELGVERGTVSSWLSGRYLPKGENETQLLRVLRASREWYYGAAGDVMPEDDNEIFYALNASWEDDPKSRMVRVPRYIEDSNYDKKEFGIFNLDVVKRADQLDEVAWLPCRGNTGAPYVMDGDTVLIDAAVTGVEVSGEYYLVDVRSHLHVYKIETELSGNLLVIDGSNQRTQSVPADAVKVCGKVIYREG